MLSPSEIAEKFRSIDAHDDTVEGFRFVPAIKRGAKAKVEVTLFRHWESKRYLLTFSGCANFQVSLDADVLEGNAPNNTCFLESSTDSAQLEKLMRKHKKAWNVSYEKSIDPLPKKISAIDKLVLFKVQIFGGVLQIAARNFSIRRIAKDNAK
jgi:hypothetical protein